MYKLARGCVLRHQKLLSLLVTVESSFEASTSTMNRAATNGIMSASSAFYVTRNVCSHCFFTNHHSKLHTSSNTLAKNVKRIIRKPVNLNKKAIKLDVVDIRLGMTVKQMASSMNKDVGTVFEALCFIPATKRINKENYVIDNLNILKEIVRLCGFRHRVVSVLKEDKVIEDKDEYPKPAAEPSKLIRRPPVVTIMGHVDHGKTTLLDSLRKSNVVAQEFGGITQHIGAFSVRLPDTQQTITFLDTPGHAAFSAMRSRGARVTDMVILVVAAEDGVMDQTSESINHAQAANVPIIVAINKIDKASSADIERTQKELLRQGLQLEEFGGDVQAVPISALKGTNLVKLQECVLALAEVCDLTSDVDGHVEGSVLESRTDSGRGKIATVLVQRGALKKGLHLVAGTSWAKVRALYNDRGETVACAMPSSAVEVTGWRDKLPNAGDQILQVDSEKRAREVVTWRETKAKVEESLLEYEIIEKKMEEHRVTHRAEVEERLAAGLRRKRKQMKQKEEVVTRKGSQLSVVLKGDVDGSVEALLDTMETYDNKQCYLDIIHFGIGAITEKDVEYAEPFGGIVYGFNVTLPNDVREFAENRNVPVRNYNVIYRLIDDLKKELTARLPPVEQEVVLGEAEVKQIFEIKEGKQKLDAAGCRCTKGQLVRGNLHRVYRNGEQVHEGIVRSLRHFKNEVESVKMNVECGVLLEDSGVKLLPGDRITCITTTKVNQKLNWEPVGFS